MLPYFFARRNSRCFHGCFAFQNLIKLTNYSLTAVDLLKTGFMNRSPDWGLYVGIVLVVEARRGDKVSLCREIRDSRLMATMLMRRNLKLADGSMRGSLQCKQDQNLYSLSLVSFKSFVPHVYFFSLCRKFPNARTHFCTRMLATLPRWRSVRGSQRWRWQWCC